jgi:CRP-like cAMP-binding protein
MTSAAFVPCTACWLRPRAYFRPLSARELDFINVMKSGHVALEPQAEIVESGQVGGSLFTLYEGWAIRYRRLPDKSRQIFDVLLPGDVIGMESHILGITDHSVQALSALSICVLRGARLQDLFEGHPEWGLSLLRWLVETQRHDDTWRAVLGRLDAEQRLAYCFLEIFDRAGQREMTEGNTCPFPLGRQHLADLLGLSPAHVGRVLKHFADQDLATISEDVLHVQNRRKLLDISGYRGIAPGPRVLL